MAAGLGATALACGDEGGGNAPAGTLASEQVDPGGRDPNTDGTLPGDIGEGSAPVVARGDEEAVITCDANEMMTNLGWVKLPGPATVGAAYVATVSYEGDEPCIAARFDSVLLDAEPQTSPVEGPLPVTISRGLDVEFGFLVAPELREQMRADLIEPAELLLESASVTWIEPPATGWLSATTLDDDPIGLQHYRLRDLLSRAEHTFVLIVTRSYSAPRVTNLDGGVDAIPLPPHPYYGTGNKGIYDCAALPLGDGGGFQLVDGVFVDRLDIDYGKLGVRADLPRRFCSELPGVDLPPGNGALPPAQ